MAYNIFNTRGTLIATVNDQRINDNFDVTLIGRNYVDYGQVFNDNLIRMIENFASPNEPVKGIEGEIYYNTDLELLSYRDAAGNWNGFGGSAITITNGKPAKVGINNKTPEFDLDVTNTFRTKGAAWINFPGHNDSDAAQTGLVLATKPKAITGTNYDGAISIWSSDVAASRLEGKIQLVTDSDADTRRLRIQATETGVAFRKLTLNESGGFVGVNTANPAYNLDVTGDGNFSANANVGVNLIFYNTGNRITGDFTSNTVAERVLFQTANVNATSSVGVIPSAASATSGFYSYNSSDPDNASWLGLEAAASASIIRSGRNGTANYLPLQLYTSNFPRVYVATDGKVGIGTNTPDTTLSVVTPATNMGINVTDNTVHTVLYNNNNVSVAGTSSNHDLTLVTNNTEHARLTAAGNFGINQKTPGAKLHVTSDIKESDGLIIDQGAGGGNNTVAIIPWVNNGSWNPVTQATDNVLVYHAGSIDNAYSGLSIVPWKSSSTGIRLDGLGNLITYSDISMYGSLRAGNWSFAANNWSSPVRKVGGITYAGGDIDFGISSTTGQANLNIDGALRQWETGKYNFFADQVGIGLTNPNIFKGKLIVKGADSVTSFTGNTGLGISVIGSSSANDYSGIDLGSNSGAQHARIAVRNTAGGSYLSFGTSLNYSSGITNQALTIDPVGLIGVNTTTPVTNVHVKGIAGTTVTNMLLDNTTAGKFHGSEYFLRQTSAATDIGATGLYHITEDDATLQNYFGVAAYDPQLSYVKDLLYYNYANDSWTLLTKNIPRLIISNNGSIMLGSGLDPKGPGTINTSGSFVNGDPVVTSKTGGDITSLFPYPVTPNQTWTFAAASRQPTYFWGTTDGNAMSVYQTATLVVAKAAKADSADALNPANSYSGVNLTLSGALSVSGAANITGAAAVGGALSTNGSFSAKGTITSAGDIIAFYASDQRLKTKIQPITSALDKVNQLDGVTFNWNDQAKTLYPEKTDAREAGLIAQQVQQVLPEVVATRDNGYLAVDYQKLVPLLVEAIKELSAKVEDLQRQIDK